MTQFKTGKSYECLTGISGYRCIFVHQCYTLSTHLFQFKHPNVLLNEHFMSHQKFILIYSHFRGTNCTELMCCSCDGTVAFIQFKPEEIGTPMNKADVVSFLKNRKWV